MNTRPSLKSADPGMSDTSRKSPESTPKGRACQKFAPIYRKLSAWSFRQTESCRAVALGAEAPELLLLGRHAGAPSLVQEPPHLPGLFVGHPEALEPPFDIAFDQMLQAGQASLPRFTLELGGDLGRKPDPFHLAV